MQLSNNIDYNLSFESFFHQYVKLEKLRKGS